METRRINEKNLKFIEMDSQLMNVSMSEREISMWKSSQHVYTPPSQIKTPPPDSIQSHAIHSRCYLLVAFPNAVIHFLDHLLMVEVDDLHITAYLLLDAEWNLYIGCNNIFFRRELLIYSDRKRQFYKFDWNITI